MNKFVILMIALCAICDQTSCKKEEKPPAKDEYYPGGGPTNGYPPKVCPLCDSSVFPYCYDKLYHDMCCCGDPNYLPPQCRFNDCSFINANSCQEHYLISECCCRSFNPFNRLKK